MAEKTKLLVGAIALVLLLTSCDQPAASPASTETEPDVVLEPTVTTVPTDAETNGHNRTNRHN